MAENEVENTNIPEENHETPVVEAQDRMVPLKEVQELREQLRQQKAMFDQSQAYQQQLMSMMQAQNQPKQPEVDVDPEIKKALSPYLKPFEERNASLERELQAARAQQAQWDAERYIERNLPNINEIRSDIAAYISANFTPQEQQAILSNPREIVHIGKLVGKEKKATVKTEAASAVRGRAVTETGSSIVRPEGKQSGLELATSGSDDAFREHLRARGFNV
jgi:hypothetical protein